MNCDLVEEVDRSELWNIFGGTLELNEVSFVLFELLLKALLVVLPERSDFLLLDVLRFGKYCPFFRLKIC